MKNRSVATLFVLVGLFLILRLAVLFSYLDELYEPEELYRGTIAREIIQGPLISLWEYLDFKVEYFPGGVLTVGILAVPFFLLFGQTYVALKLVGLFFALGTFIIWYLFLERFFNRKTAVIGALLFIFCVPFYTQTSLITWGSHPEANFFTVLSIFIFYNIFFRVNQGVTKRPDYKLFFILGLVCGFGFWFVQTYLVTIIFLLASWFVLDKKFFLRKSLFIFCFGFVAGFLPSLYHAFFYKADILAINGKTLFLELFTCDFNSILPKAILLFGQDLPNSFLFGNIFDLNGRIFSYFYYFLFLLAFVYLLWINRKHIFALWGNVVYPITLKEVTISPRSISKESLILIYPLFFFICFVFSSYSVLPQPWEDSSVWPHYIGYRYMIPVIPFILIIIAIFLGKIRRKRLIFNIFLFLFLILGLAGNLRLISLKNFGRFNQDRGYSYNIIGDKIGLRITDNLKSYIKPFDKLDADLKSQFYEGLGAGIAWRLRDEDVSRIIKIFESDVEENYRPYLYRGWGMLFSPEYPEEFNKALLIASSQPAEYRRFFYEGFGRNMLFCDKVEDIDRSIYYINRIGKPYRSFCYLGLGYAIGFELKHSPNYRPKLLNRIDKDYRPFAYQGLSLGMGVR